MLSQYGNTEQNAFNMAQPKAAFNYLNRARLRSHFYNAAKMANAIGMGYLISGRAGATLSAASFAVEAWHTHSSYQDVSKKIPAETISIIRSTDSLALKAEALKNSLGIKEDMRMFVVGGLTHIVISNPITLCISENDLKKFTEDQILEILKHEFGHHLTVSKYAEIGSVTAKYNSYLGILCSLYELNVVPLATGYAGRAINAFLASRQSVDMEYVADKFAARNSDGKIYLSVLESSHFLDDKIRMNKLLMSEAFSMQSRHISKLIDFFTKKMPEFVRKLYLKTEYYFMTSHPRPFDRFQAIASLIRREQDPQFRYKPQQEGHIFKICESCSHQKTTEKRALFQSYLREVFGSLCGHENFEVEYFNCGMTDNPDATNNKGCQDLTV